MAKNYRHLDDLVLDVTNQAGGQPFCFAFAPGEKPPLNVHWSDAVRSTGKPHDAAVNCIQALHSRRNTSWPEGIVVYQGGGYRPGHMAERMLKFVGRYKKDPSRCINFTVRVELTKCADRTEALPQFDPAELGPPPNVDLRVEAITGQRGTERAVHRLYMMLAFALVNSRVGISEEGRNIGAVLVAPDGMLLGWGLNTFQKNYTFHAELNAIQDFYHRTNQPLPEGCRIYTTLKPCHMCAGMIRDAADKPESLRVFFAQDDQSAKETALDELQGVQRLLGEAANFLGVQFVISQAKALRLEPKMLTVNRESDAATKLAIGWRDARNLTQRSRYLTSETALKVFKSASTRLLDKIRQYESDLQFGNPAVRRVLMHIYPFVQQMGIMGAGPAPVFGGQSALVAEDFLSGFTQEDWDSIDKAMSERGQ